MKTSLLLIVVCLLANSAFAQSEADSEAIMKTFESWDRGWAERNAALAVKDYAEDADWTNAFGDRFQGKEALLRGLDHIFSLDFVMSGNSDKNEFTKIEFLAPDIAVVRSKLVRKGQQTSSGDVMPDRDIHHLRVYAKRGDQWLIVSHLISQAHEKR